MSKYLKTKQGSLESAVLEAVSNAQQAAIAIAKKEKEEESVEEAKFSDKDIKMAFGVLNDPRWKGGNMTKIVDTIEKIAKGLSKFPSVAKAIQATNEELSAKQKKIDANKNGKIDGDDLAKLRAKKEEVEVDTAADSDIMEKYVAAITDMWQEAAGVKISKKEEKEDPEVKGTTMTGKPLDKIDVNPKDKKD